MTPRPAQTPALPALDDDEIERLQQLLDRVPAPLQPLDVSALDGFLCGVLLQPEPVEAARWLPCVTDIAGLALPADFDGRALHDLVLRRFDQLDRAIGARQWFDPWVFELDRQRSPAEAVLPWVAGFAAAMDSFPALMRLDDPQLLEPLALLYLHFDKDDLEDAATLQALIQTLEPPADLAEAVQDIVRALMLMADVTRPAPTATGRRPQRGGPGRRKRR
ncbi:MAG: YecA family protein [Rubrivivax sp.]